MRWFLIVGGVLLGVPVVLAVLGELSGSGNPLPLLALLALAAWVWVERGRREALAARLDAELRALRDRLAGMEALRQEVAALRSRLAAAATQDPAPAAADRTASAATGAAAEGATTARADEPAPASGTADAARAGARPARTAVLGDDAWPPQADAPAAPAVAGTPAAPVRAAGAGVAAPPTPPGASPAHAPAPGALLEPDERSAAVTSSLGASVLAWFKGGNTIVRVAVLILFIGVAFLLRYAAEQALLPLELRLAAVAAGGVALLGLGWRLRGQRRGYALTLLGAGLGVLYMTVFAAMKLYALLPVTPGFALLVALALLGAALAVLLDALPLAVVGFLGGFAAPLLASTGGGDPALLFGYCLALNVAIAVVASRRAWKLLNALGFASTSAIAAAWGLGGWEPSLLWRTEPFLIAHFALYLWIGLQYSLQLARASREATTRTTPAWAQVGGVPVVDGGLVFGLPLVTMGFQAVLLRDVPYALAASAAVLSAVYLLLGRWLWRRQGAGLRLFTEAMLAIGTVFLALIAPLALDPRWTAPAWALQGVGLVWVALRQRRAWALVFGLLLQVAAAMAQMDASYSAETPRFVLHAGFLALLMLAGAALVTAWLLQRTAEAQRYGAGAAAGSRSSTDADPGAGATAAPGNAAGSRSSTDADPGAGATAAPPLRGLQRLFAPGVLAALHTAALVLGVWHLAVAGLQEAPHAPWRWPDAGQLAVLWLLMVAVALEALHRRLRWPALAVPARPLVALAGVLALGDLAVGVAAGSGWDALMPSGAPVLLAVAGVGAWVLRRLDRDADAAAAASATAAAAAAPAADPHAHDAPGVRHTAGSTLRRALPFEGVALAGWLLAVAGLATDALVGHLVSDSAGWRVGASMAVPTAVAWAVLAGLARRRWPTDRHDGAWLAGLALPWLLMLLLWSLGVNLLGSGAMAPLPYLPLLNPIDLGHGLLLLYALRLRRALGAAGGPWGHRLQDWRVQLVGATALIAFCWLSSALVRTLHHAAGTPLWLDGALGAGLVQMALSILWTLLALATMLLAARRLPPAQARTVWLVGAALLAVVVAKLLLVDLQQTSALQRIGSFVGVGLLMLVVGYVAPLPPARVAAGGGSGQPGRGGPP